jgi:hypothetical protein
MPLVPIKVPSISRITGKCWMRLEKKKNAVNVGIFDEYDDTIEANVQFETEQGVSDDLYVGQEIYLYE